MAVLLSLKVRERESLLASNELETSMLRDGDGKRIGATAFLEGTSTWLIALDCHVASCEASCVLLSLKHWP